ncbi:hypothetical protein AMS68_005919 [Peltaster fructicola]|uniref:Mediator of RNA polymerase II transcription subunit 21 n=1 Tax=Peltaster fructicola TaxID=286661 RepID=A0A6H0Y044_9PEZI|nr:hypothetical protein AMS68_005919 [Peltaster fructicola]
MADRLTQLQDCLDDMFAALNYVQTHCPHGEIPGQPSQAAQAEETGARDVSDASRPIPIMVNGDSQAAAATKTEATTTGPLSQPAFRAALRELAQDLVVQEQKAEILINSLPGLGTSERDQRKRMQELEDELKEVEAERLRAEQDKTVLLRSLDRLIIELPRGR